jgi:hypothetical protein
LTNDILFSQYTTIFTNGFRRVRFTHQNGENRNKLRL